MRPDLFMGQMEEQTEGQRNMLNLKATNWNFSKAPVRNNIFSVTGLELAFRALFVEIQIWNYEEKWCMLTWNIRTYK
jgi:hypothetical protein